jgi:hypothetical protein
MRIQNISAGHIWRQSPCTPTSNTGQNDSKFGQVAVNRLLHAEAGEGEQAHKLSLL